MSTIYYCEMCGSPITGKAYKVVLEGSELTVCHRCYTKLQTRPGAVTPIVASKKVERRPRKSATGTPRRRPRMVDYEVVEDYAKRVKEAREKLGWTTKALAQRVMEKETVIKRIESGRLRPSIQLAQRLEKALGIKLLEPVGDDEAEPLGSLDDFSMTLGDAANIRIRGKSG